MKNRQVSLILLLCFLCTAIMFSGCTVSFMQNDTLQLSLSEPTDKTVSLIAEFEASEADSVAGDITQKAGSACAGGACLIY